MQKSSLRKQGYWQERQKVFLLHWNYISEGKENMDMNFKENDMKNLKSIIDY